MSNAAKPVVGVVMGSSSDWDVMQHAVAMLKDFNVPFEPQVVSAHRMADDMFRYAETARSRGIRAIIAGAGGAAPPPGIIAANTLNAALHAIATLAGTDDALASALEAFRAKQTEAARAMTLPV